MSLEDWVPGYRITIMSRQEWRARSTRPLSYPLSYMARNSWSLYKSQVQKFHPFMMRHLRAIMTITWKDKVTNKVILTACKSTFYGGPAHQKEPIRWVQHVMRMPSGRLSKHILFSQLPADERAVGRPRLWFKDTVKRNLKPRKINAKAWTTTANQRSVWRTAVKWKWSHCCLATDIYYHYYY